jgi:gamma-glutamyltranspeptidase/glutathione hydrolase
VIDFGMNIRQAGDALRWNHSSSSQPTDGLDDKLYNVGKVNLERSVDPQVVRDLRAIGHRVRVGDSFFGHFQTILKDSKYNVFFGASEARVDGQAAGY